MVGHGARVARVTLGTACWRGGEPVQPRASLELLGPGPRLPVHSHQRLPESTTHTADGGTGTRFLSQLGRSQLVRLSPPGGHTDPKLVNSALQPTFQPGFLSNQEPPDSSWEDRKPGLDGSTALIKA